jgi:hypothetical protein
VSIGHDVATALKPNPTEGLLPPLFLALTFVTGVVDATSYLSLGHVSVANMTGNVVFLGLGIAGAGAISAWASLTALVLFLGGGVVGGRVASALADDRDRHLRVAIGIQTVLVAAALVVAREGPSSSGPLRLRDSHRSRRPLAERRRCTLARASRLSCRNRPQPVSPASFRKARALAPRDPSARRARAARARPAGRAADGAAGRHRRASRACDRRAGWPVRRRSRRASRP